MTTFSERGLHFETFHFISSDLKFKLDIFQFSVFDTNSICMYSC